jgi:hypothetical protein
MNPSVITIIVVLIAITIAIAIVFCSKTVTSNKNNKGVHFGTEKTRIFDEMKEILIDCTEKNVKSSDASLNLKDPRYQARLSSRCIPPQ